MKYLQSLMIGIGPDLRNLYRSLDICNLHVNINSFAVFCFMENNFRAFEGEKAKKAANLVGVLNCKEIHSIIILFTAP